MIKRAESCSKRFVLGIDCVSSDRKVRRACYNFVQSYCIKRG